MNRLCWRIARLASKGLNPIEREAVQGDLLESGKTGWEAVRDVLGLVVRRQAALWMGWRPWLAAIGIAGAVGGFLSEIISGKIAGIVLLLDIYFHYGVHYDTGVTAGQDIFSIACSLLAVSLWLWISSYALGSLSGRTIWITAADVLFGSRQSNLGTPCRFGGDYDPQRQASDNSGERAIAAQFPRCPLFACSNLGNASRPSGASSQPPRDAIPDVARLPF